MGSPHWTCCEGGRNSAECAFRWSQCRCDENATPCVNGKWSCCDKIHRKDKDCGQPPQMSCCGRSGAMIEANPCAIKMDCCNVAVVDNILTQRKEAKTQGCKTRYLCCFKDAPHDGCKQKWSCCGDLNRNSKGCVHEWNCCNREVNATTIVGLNTNNNNNGNGNGVGRNINYDNSNGCVSTCSKCGKSANIINIGCGKKYSCCFGKPGSKGCKTKLVEIKGKTKWTCCGGEPGSGINANGGIIVNGGAVRGCIKKIYHSCCDKLKGSDGCEIYYPCCNTFKFQNIKRDGCIEYYKCCGSNSKTGNLKDGCVLSCCGESRLNDSSKNGCLEICTQCEGKWNDKKVKGCGIGKNYQHKTQEI